MGGETGRRAGRARLARRNLLSVSGDFYREILSAKLLQVMGQTSTSSGHDGVEADTRILGFSSEVVQETVEGLPAFLHAAHAGLELVAFDEALCRAWLNFLDDGGSGALVELVVDAVWGPRAKVKSLAAIFDMFSKVY